MLRCRINRNRDIFNISDTNRLMRQLVIIRPLSLSISCADFFPTKQGIKTQRPQSLTARRRVCTRFYGRFYAHLFHTQADLCCMASCRKVWKACLKLLHTSSRNRHHIGNLWFVTLTPLALCYPYKNGRKGYNNIPHVFQHVVAYAWCTWFVFYTNTVIQIKYCSILRTVS